MASKWSHLDSKILELYREDETLGYSKAARMLIGDNASKEDVDLLRTYVKRQVCKDVDFVNNTETDDSTYNEGLIETDAFARYCKDEGIDISRAKSAKYVNHIGQQKFNVVLDYNSKKFDWDKFREVMLQEVVPQELKHQSKRENNLSLHLYHSDLHIGAEVSSNSLYSNNYSLDVVLDRLSQVRQLVLQKVHFFGVFDTLAMFDLGDMLDGQDGKTTRGGHSLQQNMESKQQFEGAIQAYKQHIATLVNSGVAENFVFYATCNDNHSGSFSYYALRAIAEWCMIRYPQVRVVIQTKFIDVYEYGRHNFIITHGKDEQFMKHGMPKYLDKKTEIYIKDYIEYHKLDGYLHFVKGDLHQDCVDFCNKFRYRNTLSLFGSSEWVFTTIGYGRAGLSYDVVDKGSKDVMEGRIFFSE
jgi:hypothetical protein